MRPAHGRRQCAQRAAACAARGSTQAACRQHAGVHAAACRCSQEVQRQPDTGSCTQQARKLQADGAPQLTGCRSAGCRSTRHFATVQALADRAPAPPPSALQAENKFKCPCHGSQYDATGKKIRGPAPLVRCGSSSSSSLGACSRCSRQLRQRCGAAALALGSRACCPRMHISVLAALRQPVDALQRQPVDALQRQPVGTPRASAAGGWHPPHPRPPLPPARSPWRWRTPTWMRPTTCCSAPGPRPTSAPARTPGGSKRRKPGLKAATLATFGPLSATFCSGGRRGAAVQLATAAAAPAGLAMQRMPWQQLALAL